MFSYYYTGLKYFSNEGRLVRYTRCEIQNELSIFCCMLTIKEQLCFVLYAVIIRDQIFHKKVLSLQFPYENRMTAADMCQLCEILGSASAVCLC